MPSVTPKQAKFMRAIAHGWKPSRMKSPPSRKVAREFMKEDQKRKNYQYGGLAAAQMMRRPEVRGLFTRGRTAPGRAPYAGGEPTYGQPGGPGGGLQRYVQRGFPQRGTDAVATTPQMREMMQRKGWRGFGGTGRTFDTTRRPTPEMMEALRAKGPGGFGSRGVTAGVMPGRQMLRSGERGFPRSRYLLGARKQLGSGPQQGALARALQTQTGRSPLSRRMAFPGRIQ